MAKTKLLSRTRKKELRSLISSKLEDALADIKPMLSEKKFRRRLDKATKLLTARLKAVKEVKEVNEPTTKPPAPALRNADDSTRHAM